MVAMAVRAMTVGNADMTTTTRQIVPDGYLHRGRLTRTKDAIE